MKLPVSAFHPLGLNIGAPPGLDRPADILPSAQHVELGAKYAKLMNERLGFETHRLAHQNALLRLQLQTQVMAPPVLHGSLCGSSPNIPPSAREVLESSQLRVLQEISKGADVSHDTETTVIMRNIPNNYDRTMLLSLVDSEGFRGAYNFVYLPIDFTSRAGLGYSFINFVSAMDAARFGRHFHEFNRWGVCSEKACDTSGKATHQGLEAIIDRFRNSPVMHEIVPDEFRPVLFTHGVRVAFPPPTQRIKAPKLRHRTSSNVSSGSD